MIAQTLEAPRFIRKTRLGEGEYHKNFQKLDVDIIQTITSREADRVTPLMSKIYLRLTTAPAQYWEREGVLRFEAEWREGKHIKAWSVLCEMLSVASATASKALAWMHDSGVIGYFSGKNGVGIRIFLNRAASSIGEKRAQRGEKILQFPPASTAAARGSRNEPAFNDSFAVSEVLDTDFNSRAPKNGADQEQADKIPSDLTRHTPTEHFPNTRPYPTMLSTSGVVSLDEIVMRLRAELEPAMQTAARNAAAREHERTREWLENRGLPKAARVAQHEAYNVLRKHGVISESARSSRTHADVGRSDYTPPEPHPLTYDEITELAEACVAMLETKGQSIDLTLSEMSAEAGGFLLPEDAGRVRDHANALLSANNSREGK
jgi:CRP-like cAMP-binding protein